MKTQGLGPGFEWGDSFGKGANGGDTGAAEGRAEAGSGIGDHGLLATLEEWEVREGIADVGEIVAEAGLEG